MSTLLEARGLSKEYLRGETPFSAVQDASLSLESGEFVCIVGRSGSGKSTLLNMLAGLLTPDAGSVIFDGTPYSDMDDEAISLLRNTRLGYIMQGYSALPNFTAIQNVMLPWSLSKRDGDPAARAFALLEKVGLSELAHQYPASLSGGELRRVSIARALLASPSVLLADEPTGDLDEETAAGITELFASIAREGTAVLLVTHDADAAARADRRFTMNAGRLEQAQA